MAYSIHQRPESGGLCARARGNKGTRDVSTQRHVTPSQQGGRRRRLPVVTYSRVPCGLPPGSTQRTQRCAAETKEKKWVRRAQDQEKKKRSGGVVGVTRARRSHSCGTCRPCRRSAISYRTRWTCPRASSPPPASPLPASPPLVCATPPPQMHVSPGLVRVC